MGTVLVRAALAAIGAALVIGAVACGPVDLSFYVYDCSTPFADASAPDGASDPCNCTRGCDCFGDGGADYQTCLAALADAGDAGVP